jgi:hypothetical protein
VRCSTMKLLTPIARTFHRDDPVKFMAVPRRLPVLWAKLVVFAVVVFVLMLAASVIAFFKRRLHTRR